MKRTCLLTALCLGALAAPASSQDSGLRGREEPRVTFEQAVEKLVEVVKKASKNDRLNVQVEQVTAASLGWEIPANTKARKITLMLPNGAGMAFAAFERKTGTYKPGQDGYPNLIGISQYLVLVDAPQPRVALSGEAMNAARPIIQRATAPLRSLAGGKAVKKEELQGSLTSAKKVTRNKHYLDVELPEGGTLAPADAWALDTTAVAYRAVPAEGPIPAHTIVVR